MPRNLIPAVILITLGVLFLTNNLGWTDIGLGRLVATWWPLLLIAAGVGLLVKGRRA